MGLTQVSTDGVKNDAITKTKIPANQIEASELADNAVDTNAIANNAVTAGKLASGVQTTINNNADNRVITGSGSANTLNGEANCTFNGDSLGLNSSSTSELNLQYSNNTRFKIQAGSNFAQFLTQNDVPLAFKTDAGTGSGTERLRVTDNGLTFNGDTAAANALNDYEEGTWTPALMGGNSLAESNGRYVKIGKMVYAFWEITLNTNSQSAHLILNNLPFTSTNTEPSSGGNAKDYQTYDIQDGPIYHIPKGNTQVQFYKNSGQNFTQSNGSGLNFRACSIYQSAS